VRAIKFSALFDEASLAEVDRFIGHDLDDPLRERKSGHPVEDEWLDRCRSLPWLASLYRRIREAPDLVITWRDRTFTDVSSLERFVRDDERDDSRGRACD